jgi:hypothetical protein
VKNGSVAAKENLVSGRHAPPDHSSMEVTQVGLITLSGTPRP